MRFQDQVVVVTGASRGIGRGIADAFAREGANVACVATTEMGSKATADAIRGGARAYGCDVSDSKSVDSLFNKIQEEMGTPSVLVNNAGVARDTLLLRMKDEDWDT